MSTVLQEAPREEQSGDRWDSLENSEVGFACIPLQVINRKLVVYYGICHF